MAVVTITVKVYTEAAIPDEAVLRRSIRESLDNLAYVKMGGEVIKGTVNITVAGGQQ